MVAEGTFNQEVEHALNVNLPHLLNECRLDTVNAHGVRTTILINSEKLVVPFDY